MGTLLRYGLNLRVDLETGAATRNAWSKIKRLKINRLSLPAADERSR